MSGRAAAAIAVLAAGVLVGVRYRRDCARARQRLELFDVHTLKTPFGTVEFCERGTGDPALLIHGVVGGWDGGPTWRTFPVEAG